MPKLPIDYNEFLDYLAAMKKKGIDTSETGDRLVAYANGLNNLQGHVKQSFFGVQLFLVHNKKMIRTIAASDPTIPFPLKGRILSKWAHFLTHRNDRTNEYDLQTLRDILPTYAGGIQTSGRGAIAEVRRSLVPVAQLLMKRGYGPDDATELDSDSDSSGVPARRKQTTLRIVRDTEMVRKLKSKYRFACQVCGYPCIQVGPADYYIEGHHLRPLGGVHNGSDTADNIILLCPNHHVLFDKFAISISPHDGRTVVSPNRKLHGRRMLMKHRLSKDNIRYHFQRFQSSQI